MELAVSLNVLKYTFSTKIFALEIAPVLFILVRVLYDFTIVSDVHILLSPHIKTRNQQIHQ